MSSQSNNNAIFQNSEIENIQIPNSKLYSKKHEKERWELAESLRA